MTSELVQTGETEPINVLAVGANGNPLTGLTDIEIRIRRQSDGFYLDFSDDTFKTSGSVTDIDRVLTEIDATNAPGLYGTSLDTSLITNLTAKAETLETLQVIPFQSSGSNAKLPGPGELRVGLLADQVREYWRRKGLDENNEAVYTATSVKVPADGSLIDQTLVEAPAGTVTVTKLP